MGEMGERFQDSSKWCPEKASELHWIARMVVFISCNSSYCTTCVWGASSISCSRRIHRCVCSCSFSIQQKSCVLKDQQTYRSLKLSYKPQLMEHFGFEFLRCPRGNVAIEKEKAHDLNNLLGKCISALCTQTSYCGNKFDYLFRRFLQWLLEAALKSLDEGLLAHRAGRSLCPRPCQTSPRCRCDGLCQCRPA